MISQQVWKDAYANLNYDPVLPALLVEGQKQRYQPFMEYEDKGTNRALLFPITKEGEIDFLILTPKAQRLWFNIKAQSNRWIKTKVISLIIPSQPAIVACRCHNLVHVPFDYSQDASCPTCHIHYTMSNVMKLPRLEREIIRTERNYQEKI